MVSYQSESFSSKWELLSLPPSSLELWRKERAKKAALILLKNSHFDRTLRYSLSRQCKLQTATGEDQKALFDRTIHTPTTLKKMAQAIGFQGCPGLLRQIFLPLPPRSCKWNVEIQFQLSKVINWLTYSPDICRIYSKCQKFQAKNLANMA